MPRSAAAVILALTVVLLPRLVAAQKATSQTAQDLKRLSIEELTYLHSRMTLDPGSRDVTAGASEANDPSYFASLRSYLDLPHGFALDGFLRHVARRPNPEVPAYSELDLRLGWTVRAGWELSLVGQNLLHGRHPELGAPGPLRYEFERGVYARSAWRF